MSLSSWVYDVLLIVSRQSPPYREARLSRLSPLPVRQRRERSTPTLPVQRNYPAAIGAAVVVVVIIAIVGFSMASPHGWLIIPESHSAVTSTPAEPLPPTPAPAGDPGSVGGGFGTLLVVSGAVLVLAGLGTIGLILLRRQQWERDEEESNPGASRLPEDLPPTFTGGAEPAETTPAQTEQHGSDPGISTHL
jgi:hypothetical protein